MEGRRQRNVEAKSLGALLVLVSAFLRPGRMSPWWFRETSLFSGNQTFMAEASLNWSHLTCHQMALTENTQNIDLPGMGSQRAPART